MEFKDKVLLLIAMDDYGTKNTGYEYTLGFDNNDEAILVFFDENETIELLSFSVKNTPRRGDVERYFNDPKLFFQAVREIVYEV